MPGSLCSQKICLLLCCGDVDRRVRGTFFLRTPPTQSLPVLPIVTSLHRRVSSKIHTTFAGKNWISPMPLFPPQSPYSPPCNWTRVFASEGGGRLSDRAMRPEAASTPVLSMSHIHVIQFEFFLFTPPSKQFCTFSPSPASGPPYWRPTGNPYTWQHWNATHLFAFVLLVSHTDSDWMQQVEHRLF